MTTTTLKKVKVDLMAELDRITKEKPNMEPWEMREKIGEVFRLSALAAGWAFRRETWPVMVDAINASINNTPEQEVIGYIEKLNQYCEA